MKPCLALSAASLVLALCVPAGAEPAYLDDRSSPETLIRSLYNAINRKEYARAYSYFGTPPAPTLEDYAAGYEDTESVEVMTGSASAEGAAGSIFHSLPVSILARDRNGEEHLFAGCYDMRFIQPSVQTEPYRPLQIEKGKLAPAEGSLDEALPASCGEGPPADLQLERARRLFAAAYGDICDSEALEEEPESHVIRFGHDSADDEESEGRIFRFLCARGAYNEEHVYLFADNGGEILPLQFAVPELDIRYENGDTEGRVEEMHVIGYVTRDRLANSGFDPDTLTIASHEKWRGPGDASSSGQWLFRKGAFSLVRYDVDASYDGEVNPETVLDYSVAP